MRDIEKEIRIIRKPIKVDDDIFAKLAKPAEPEPEDEWPEYGVPKDIKDWDIPF